MKSIFRMCICAVLAIAVPHLSSACVVAARMDLRDIFAADAVILGIILDYEIVDVGDVGPLPNYARIKVIVRDVVYGELDADLSDNGSLTITWDNSTFAEPENLPRNLRGHLIALRSPSSPMLPLRAPSATILPAPEPDTYTILQAPCAGAFLFEADSLIGIALQQILEADESERETVMAILEEFLLKRGAIGSMERKLYEAREGRERP